MNILISICARGGSKGIPKKNIRPLNGIPLIAYTIKTANAFRKKRIDLSIDIELSTDDEKIKQVAAEYDLNSTYLRPDKFATDKAGKVDAIKDLLFYSEKTHKKKYDYVLDLDVTSPLRTINDLEEGLTLMENDLSTLTLFSLSHAHRNPYFNMVQTREDGYVELIKPLNKNILSRQMAPSVYDLNASFYYYRRSFFDKKTQSVITNKSRGYLMNHLCFDIDEPIDFEIMAFLFREKKIDFSLV